VTLPDPIKVARDLTALIDYDEQLLTQAIHNANTQVEGHSLPGGDAMVALAPVASIVRWHQRVAQAEHDWMTARAVELPNYPGLLVADSRERPEWGADEEERWEPPLQTVRFWSDHYRNVKQQDWDHVPTLVTEAKFLKFHLDWILTHEPNADRFASDIAAARKRIEDLLSAGERSERGVPCMYEECKGVRLVRRLVPSRSKDGEKVWVQTDWYCPRCKRKWDEETYWRNVNAANERAQTEEIAGATWCSVEYAARKVQRPVKTIRTWVNRGELPVACIIRGRRSRFVPLDDVRARHDQAQRRSRAR
jgi:hypothetical protein